MDNSVGVRERVNELNLAECRIEEIESLLGEIHQESHNVWWIYATLIRTVETRELYKQKGLNSMTAWIKQYCHSHRIQEARMWQYKRAAEIFLGYKERNSDVEVEIQNVKVAAQTLENIEKAAGRIYGNSEGMRSERESYVDRNIERALKGELNRDEAQDMARRAKFSVRKVVGEEGSVDGGAVQKEKNVDPELVEKRVRDTKKADDIKRAIAKDYSWTGREMNKPEINMKAHASDRTCYLTMNEFSLPALEEDMQSKYVPDVALVENLTTPKPYDLYFNLFEIKVTAYDFERDRKFTRYADYCDFLWLVAPEEVLLEINPDEVPDGIGVLAYHSPESEEPKVELVDQEGEEGRRFCRSNSFFNDGTVLYIVRPADLNVNSDRSEIERALRSWILRRR